MERDGVVAAVAVVPVGAPVGGAQVNLDIAVAPRARVVHQHGVAEVGSRASAAAAPRRRCDSVRRSACGAARHGTRRWPRGAVSPLRACELHACWRLPLLCVGRRVITVVRGQERKCGGTSGEQARSRALDTASALRDRPLGRGRTRRCRGRRVALGPDSAVQCAVTSLLDRGCGCPSRVAEMRIDVLRNVSSPTVYRTRLDQLRPGHEHATHRDNREYRDGRSSDRRGGRGGARVRGVGAWRRFAARRRRPGLHDANADSGADHPRAARR